MGLDNKIINKKFQTSLYDKRDSFLFSIKRIPYLGSDIPSRIFYLSIGAAILQIGRTYNTNSIPIVLLKLLHNAW